ncbi:ATP-binding protein [Jeotgalibacillus soli]|uniref:ATP-binding protein n=1 Tax=Jeotgalibacillus soli TaxID=889306 RepID=UPI000A06D414|nr:ATP-binding protein [Jeotgalibacillus soli]
MVNPFSIYAYLIYFYWYYQCLVNLLFFYFCIILASLYQNRFIILLTSISTSILTIFFIYRNILLRCEENQLKQVLLNLYKNAADAMPDGITISLQNKKIMQLGEPFVSIAITDTGVGIPEEIINRIGDPFFTTKEKGTGLGMMITKKIIQDHNGSLDISSKVGQGTTISLTLPLLPPKKG